MTINKKFNLVKARTFGLLHQLTVSLLDAAVSYNTTPTTPPPTQPCSNGVTKPLFPFGLPDPWSRQAQWKWLP